MPFAVRPQFDWRLRTRTLPLGQRTLIMGILNATPDSFSDGGQFLDPRAALTHALEMLDDGADILDLGGESTRPNSTPVTPAEEQSRVLPVLRAILAARPNAILSIDTYHAETARLAIESGAEIVNDVSGFLWDEAMAATCASLNCGAVLMHTRDRPQQWRTLPALAPAEVLPLVLRELCVRRDAALAAGIRRDAIVLDPGFGFGKSFDENFPLLAHLDTLHALGFPLLAGLSRKGFLRRTLQQAESIHVPNPVQSTHPNHSLQDATLAANTAAILAGAHILRVHDVRPARQAAAIADRILAAASPHSPSAD
jgi:dihydropteroate synthase